MSEFCRVRVPRVLGKASIVSTCGLSGHQRASRNPHSPRFASSLSLRSSELLKMLQRHSCVQGCSLHPSLNAALLAGLSEDRGRCLRAGSCDTCQDAWGLQLSPQVETNTISLTSGAGLCLTEHCGLHQDQSCEVRVRAPVAWPRPLTAICSFMHAVACMCSM